MWGICLKLVERVFGRQKSEPSVFGDKGFRGFPGNQTGVDYYAWALGFCYKTVRVQILVRFPPPASWVSPCVFIVVI